MMRRGLLIPTLLVLAFAFPAGASSLFSPLGLGSWTRNHNAYSSAVSGANLAVVDSLYFPLNNPAGWRSYGQTKFSVSMLSEKVRAKDASGTDVTDNFSFPYAGITMPIYRSVGLGLVYQSLTDHDYLIFQDGSVALDNPVDTLESYDLLRRIQGNGGLSLGGARVALKLSTWLVLGAGFDYYFGSLEELTTTDFVQGEFSRSGRFVRNDISGVGGQVGVIAEANDHTSFAVTATLPTTLDVTSTVTIEGGDSTRIEGLSYDLPMGVDVAGAYSQNRMRVMARAGMRNWETGDRDITASQPYTNSYSLALGIERLPLHEPLVPWYDIWTFRAGGHVGQEYVEAGGNPVMNWGVSLGIGIPIANGRGMLDTALWFDARGNVDDNLAREHIYGLQISITASERWFNRRAR